MEVLPQNPALLHLSLSSWFLYYYSYSLILEFLNNFFFYVVAGSEDCPEVPGGQAVQQSGGGGNDSDGERRVISVVRGHRLPKSHGCHWEKECIYRVNILNILT